MRFLDTLKVFSNYRDYLRTIFPQIFGCVINGELIVMVPLLKLKKFLLFLRDHSHSQFKILADLTGADYPDKKNRFEVIYNLLSITYNSRVTVITCVDEVTAVDSITDVYSCANWYEREVWDMFGVFFFNNMDLRRILTDYGFKGHPLRKDFPLTGYFEVCYDIIQKKIINDKVTLSQDYRDFTFSPNWSIFRNIRRNINAI